MIVGEWKREEVVCAMMAYRKKTVLEPGNKVEKRRCNNWTGQYIENTWGIDAAHTLANPRELCLKGWYLPLLLPLNTFRPWNQRYFITLIGFIFSEAWESLRFIRQVYGEWSIDKSLRSSDPMEGFFFEETRELALKDFEYVKDYFMRLKNELEEKWV